MILYLLAFLIGVVAGLRTMTAAAAVSWAAWMGALPLAGTPLAFLGATVTPWILTVLALGELVADHLTGAGLGLMGALIGTYGGAEARSRLAAAFGRDRPAALIEDAVAVAGAVLIVVALA